MNKSRRAVAVASREFARDGWSVLQIDFSGCGDSSGDFSGARWEAWKKTFYSPPRGLTSATSDQDLLGTEARCAAGIQRRRSH
jgi:hypothetical protein